MGGEFDSGAKTAVSICRSTATEINSVVDENLISIFFDNPSSGTPYGTYVVEVLSTKQDGLSKKIDIKLPSLSV